MDANVRTLMQKAATRMGALIEEVDELRQKVAAFERGVLAEDIAIMQAAEGVISYEDLLGERDRLVASGDDLGAVKMAMQRYGPGKTTVRTVASEAAPVNHDETKVASNEPEHLAKARLELEGVLGAL